MMNRVLPMMNRDESAKDKLHNNNNQLNDVEKKKKYTIYIIRALNGYVMVRWIPTWLYFSVSIVPYGYLLFSLLQRQQ